MRLLSDFNRCFIGVFCNRFMFFHPFSIFTVRFSIDVLFSETAFLWDHFSVLFSLTLYFTVWFSIHVLFQRQHFVAFYNPIFHRPLLSDQRYKFTSKTGQHLFNWLNCQTHNPGEFSPPSLWILHQQSFLFQPKEVSLLESKLFLCVAVVLTKKTRVLKNGSKFKQNHVCFPHVLLGVRIFTF